MCELCKLWWDPAIKYLYLDSSYCFLAQRRCEQSSLSLQGEGFRNRYTAWRKVNIFSSSLMFFSLLHPVISPDCVCLSVSGSDSCWNESVMSSWTICCLCESWVGYQTSALGCLLAQTGRRCAVLMFSFVSPLIQSLMLYATRILNSTRHNKSFEYRSILLSWSWSL